MKCWDLLWKLKFTALCGCWNQVYINYLYAIVIYSVRFLFLVLCLCLSVLLATKSVPDEANSQNCAVINVTQSVNSYRRYQGLVLWLCRLFRLVVRLFRCGHLDRQQTERMTAVILVTLPIVQAEEVGALSVSRLRVDIER